MLVVSAMSERTGTVLDPDVLCAFRLRLLDHAREVGIGEACRTFGIHRSTFYRWERMVERSGLEMLRPRERRPPRMPNQTSPVIETRVLAFAIAHPGLGPRRISSQPGLGALGRHRHQPQRGPADPASAWAESTGRAPLVRGRLRRPARPRDISRSSVPASSWASTASTWAGSRARRSRSGSTPPSTMPTRSSGPSCIRRR